MNKEEIRKNERAKYDKAYFENVYWVEDFPDKENYRKFKYNDPTHEKRFLFLSDLLIEYFDFETFLDAGCGMGNIIRNLMEKGYDCKGTEISEDALKYYMNDLVKKRIVFYASLDKLPFKKNDFDLVFSSDVMEHIPIFDVKESINELIRVAKKYLVLTINLDHPYKYHPTILSRETWEALFLESGEVKQLKKLENKINKECKEKYGEYEFFVFEKMN